MLRQEMARAVVRGSGNALADLGIPGVDEKETKTQLAYAVNEICRKRGLKQQQVARLLNVTQPKVSALANYRLSGFSVERLMNFVNALGRDIEIVIRPTRNRRIAKIRVTAA